MITSSYHITSNSVDLFLSRYFFNMQLMWLNAMTFHLQFMFSSVGEHCWPLLIARLTL